MTIEEIRTKIFSIETRINQLKMSNGSVDEIRELDHQLTSLNEELDRQQEHQSYIEEQRIAAFQDVKKEYKKNSPWNRLINKIQGKSPNWKKVSDYSLEQLNHLLKVREGETKFQQDSDKMRFKRNIDDEKNGRKYLSQAALDKSIDNAHKYAFNDQLSSDTSLDKSMELEASNGRW